VGARDAIDAVPERLDQAFDVHGDQRLVLDNEDLRGDLLRDLTTSLVDKAGDFGLRLPQNVGDLRCGEVLHCHQKKGLAWQRRYGLEPPRGVVKLTRGELDPGQD
jgi:hypothetical protein